VIIQGSKEWLARLAQGETHYSLFMLLGWSTTSITSPVMWSMHPNILGRILMFNYTVQQPRQPWNVRRKVSHKPTMSVCHVS